VVRSDVEVDPRGRLDSPGGGNRGAQRAVGLVLCVGLHVHARKDRVDRGRPVTHLVAVRVDDERGAAPSDRLGKEEGHWSSPRFRRCASTVRIHASLTPASNAAADQLIVWPPTCMDERPGMVSYAYRACARTTSAMSSGIGS